MRRTIRHIEISSARPHGASGHPGPSPFTWAARSKTCTTTARFAVRRPPACSRSSYGLAIQIKSFLTAVSDKETDVEPPDAVVTDLCQVVDLVTHG